MRIVLPQPSESVLYEGVGWAEFEELIDELGDRSGLRIAYDRGTLEIMSPGIDHEMVKEVLGQLLEVICDLLGIDYVSCGSLRMLRPDLFRGLEPDTCYYIANVATGIRDTPLDLRRDPPPDLAIEVDITSHSLDRFPIYAALGVPELWRYRKGRIEALALRSDGECDTIECGLAFPWLRVDELSPFVAMRASRSNRAIKEAFREWVREHHSSR